MSVHRRVFVVAADLIVRSQSSPMIPALLAAGGVMHRRDLLHHVRAHVVEQAVRSGRLLRPFPQVYVLPEVSADPMTTVRAGLCYGGSGAVLSHTTATALHGLSDVVGPTDPVHVAIGRSRPRSFPPTVVMHHGQRLSDVIVRQGLPIFRLEESLVDSWGWVKADDRLRRALVIEAVGRRLTTPQRLQTVAAQQPTVAGRKDLVRLVYLLAAGCRSELELWGYDRVFDCPGMPPFERDVAVDLGGRTIYLDLLHRATLTNMELDGRRWHTAPADRERDLRRDAALLARGYVVMRVSGARLYREPEIVRAEVLEVIRRRSCRLAP